MREAAHYVPGVAYHLIWRFVNHEYLIELEEERAFYVFLLGRALKQSDWRSLAYTVMSNHLHHSMVAGFKPPSSWTISAHGTFATWINQRKGRIGSMFARGPKAYAILPENEGRVIAYIHNNPVRAGLASRARNSTWSSHQAYVGLAPRPPWLHVGEGLARAGFSDGDAFDQWVDSAPGDATHAKLEGIRRAARRRGALEVATPIVGALTHAPLVARPFARIRLDPRRLVQMVCRIVRISESEICSRKRTAVVLAARRIVVQCGRTLGLTGSDIAAVLGVSQQAVSHIALHGLHAEDGPVVDLVLDHLRGEHAARGDVLHA